MKRFLYSSGLVYHANPQKGALAYVQEGMRTLKQIGFDGYMNLECGVPGPYDVVLPEVAEFLRKVHANA